ncbi:MAG: four helix bundle protein [Chloroflexota bacterium]|nr:four helix bundle protein [Chloroflexota bacterium]
MKREDVKDVKRGARGVWVMKYEEWVTSVPAEITGDTLWRMEAYRLALFAGDWGWFDSIKLMKDRHLMSLADQLYRALGSLSANLAEGYLRGTGKDRARFYEYAQGSARESRDWYYKARHVLGEEVTTHRLRLLTQIIRLLLTMVPQQRGCILRETGFGYQTGPDHTLPETVTEEENLNTS